MKRALLRAIAALVPLTSVDAAPLVLTKTSVVVADQVNLANPKAIPNATLDYAIRVDNPNSLLSGQAIGAVMIQDFIPDTVILRVADYGVADRGPVEFMDGNPLGLGLLGSGLDYSYLGLASTSDGLEFYNGTTWAYTPVADAQGYDANVRGVRIKLTGGQAVSSSFRLRFRVRLK